MTWEKDREDFIWILFGSFGYYSYFCHNIYNEYCNLYCQLLYKKLWNSNEIMDVIRELDYNAKIYRFGAYVDKEKITMIGV